MSWSFGSVDLDQAGKWHPVELDGIDLPDVRGDNITIPYQHGTVWVPKFFDQRTVSIGMVVEGTSLQDLQTNINSLMALFGARYQQLLVRTMEDISTRQALAEVVKRPNLAMKGPTAARMIVEFQLADPFFRSSTLSTELDTIDADPTSITLTNPGTAEERCAIIILTGPLSHPIITNNTNGVVLQYDDVLASASNTVTIDCKACTAVDENGSNVVGKIVHCGDPNFMVLAAAENDISVADGTATTGTIEFDWYPSYL